MAKAGRKRKEGRREANGRLQRPYKSETVGYWQREMDVLREGSVDWRLTTPLGVLLRAKTIDLHEFECGMRFSDLREAADGAQGLPARIPAAQNVTAVHGADGDVETDAEIRRKRRAIEAYYDACFAVGWNSNALAALELVAVYQRRPDKYEQVVDCVAALKKLVAYFHRGR